MLCLAPRISYKFFSGRRGFFFLLLVEVVVDWLPSLLLIGSLSVTDEYI